MALVSELISEAQSLTRQSLSITNATYISWLNRINRAYCRKWNGPDMRVLNAVLTSVASQAGYDLPAAFSRISGQFVFWNSQAITGGYQLGIPVRFLNQGNEEDDRKIGQWTQTGGGFGSLNPQVCYVEPKSGTPATKQMVFAPFPATSGITILYNYYREPAAFTAVSDTIPISLLQDTFTMALCRNIAMYLGANDDAMMYMGMEKSEYRSALTVLTAQ